MDYGLMDGPDVAPLDPLQAAKRNMHAYTHLIRPTRVCLVGVLIL